MFKINAISKPGERTTFLLQRFIMRVCAERSDIIKFSYWCTEKRCTAKRHYLILNLRRYKSAKYLQQGQQSIGRKSVINFKIAKKRGGVKAFSLKDGVKIGNFLVLKIVGDIPTKLSGYSYSVKVEHDQICITLEKDPNTSNLKLCLTQQTYALSYQEEQHE